MKPARNSPDPETLLAESAWIRRLARSLLRDAHAAEDLSQEVLAAALTTRPAFQGARLRGWLAGVTRHLAAGTRARERRRSEVERRAARPEGGGSDAHERLVLHQRLAAAIDELPEPYRATLVARYLDDQPPRVIARREGLPVTTVRKRVSRGLALLRARLDEEFADEDGRSGRAAWCLACVGLLRRPAELGTLPLIGVLGMGTLVKLTAATAAVLVVVLWITRPWEGSEPIAPRSLEEVAPLVEGEERPVKTDSPAAVDLGGERVPVPASPTESSTAAPRLRVVDEAGEALPDARAVWLDARHRIVPVELDEDGCAPLPDAREGTRVFATHEGLLPARARLESGEDDLLLTLEMGIAVQGRILENGEVPREPIRLRLSEHDPVEGFEYSDWQLEGRLRDQGFLPAYEFGWTEADGSFRFPGRRAGGRGTLMLQGSHLLAGKTRREGPYEERVPFTIDGSPLLIETIPLPVVEGRLVWSDDGSAVVDGEIQFQFSAPDGMPSTGWSEWADASGRFAIGLYVDDWLTLSEEQRAAAPGQLGTLHLRGIGTVSNSALNTTRELVLDGLSFPHDLGTIELERVRRLAVRVLDSGGEGMEGAVLRSAIGRAVTDESGQAVLSCWGDASEEIAVLARGHALGLFRMEDAPDTEDEPWDLPLQPGIELLFRMTGADGGFPEDAELWVTWDENPFQRSELGPEPYDHSLHNKEVSARFEGENFRSTLPYSGNRVRFVPDARGEARLLALLPGKVLRVSLMHSRGGVLLRREITTPERPGVETVTLAMPAVSDTANVVLRGRVVDERGIALPGARVSVRLGSPRHIGFDSDEQGHFESGPLEPGTVTYTASAAGHVNHEHTELELVSGLEPLHIVLPRSRRVTVHVRDEAGRLLRIQDVEASDTNGRSYYNAWPEKPGLVDFEKLPREPLELEVTVGLRRWTQQIGAEEREVTFTLPPHGTLIASFTHEELVRETEYLIMIVDPLDGSEALRIGESFSFREDATGPFNLETELLPGTYRVEVRKNEEPGKPEGEGLETVLLPAQVVTIEAGETEAVRCQD